MNIKEVLQVFVCKLPKHHQPGKYHENINETTVLDFEICILYTETYALIISSTSYHLQPQHAFMQKLRFILSDVTIALQ